MKNVQQSVAAGAPLSFVAGVAALLLLGLTFAAPAASTDIANTPINSASTGTAKPNVMLLMDTSKSILFTHAPNALEGTTTPPVAPQPIGYRANQCNSIYYNPTTVYQLPVDSTGTPLPIPAFNAAPYNYYSPSNLSVASLATVDLNSQFQAFDQNTRARNSSDANDQPQRAYYYVYTTTAGATPAMLPYATSPCTDAYGTPMAPATAVPQFPTPAGSFGTTATTGGFWTRVLVGALGTTGVTVDETQNFAIWYSYYRTRVALTKSGIGLSFSSLTDSFRVGFINGNPLIKATPSSVPTAPISVDPASYLALDDFTPAQKSLWYAKLYTQVPGGSSPMREGLARVGRHYANKSDSINNGMALQFAGAGDSVSCRQNYAIMTTGGYWSRYAETAGPVQMDGTTLVGEQDGVLDAVDPNPKPPWGNVNVTPRPIYDGSTTGTTTTIDNWNTYSATSCPTGQVMKSTVQNLQSTTQLTQSTSQPTQSTSQIQQSTTQITRGTTQQTQSTSQYQRVQTQTMATTTAVTRSTLQQWQTTTQYLSSTLSPTSQTLQTLRSTSAQTMDTTQTLQSTTQMRQSTAQNLVSTSTVQQSTGQWLTNWSQLQISTVQANRSTAQTNQWTSQNLQATFQSTLSTSQWWATDSQNSTPVASCTATTEITCDELKTGPDPIIPGAAPCDTAPVGVNTWSIPASAGNNYVASTCVNINTPPTGVASCTAQPGDAAHGYLKITCTPNDTGPTPMDAASCAAASANSGNGFTTTICPVTGTGPTPVASCTPVAASVGNAWTATLCSNVTTGPSGVASCATDPPVAANNYVQTNCNTATGTNTPVQFACPATSGSASVAPFVVTTCWQNNTGATLVASCTNSAGTLANGWVTTTCTPNIVLPYPVASCTPSGPTSGNGYTTTTCSTNDTSLVPVSSCNPSGATPGNGYVTTTCTPNNTSGVGVVSCTASGPTSSNGWTTTACSTPVTTGPVAVDPTTCTGNVTASSSNGWVNTTCTPNNSAVTMVSSCNYIAPDLSNNWTTTVCGTYISAPVGVPSCTASATVTCPSPIVTTMPVLSCALVAASAGNSWTETTCPTVKTGPTPVEACIPITWDILVAAGYFTPTYIRQSFTGNGTSPAYNAAPGAIPSGPGGAWNMYLALFGVGSSAPLYANNYTQTICNTVTTAPTPVASCTAAIASAGNGWIETQCTPSVVTTGLSPTAVCTPDSPTPANNYTSTTCPTTITGPVGVMPGTCKNQIADATNGWLTITCNTVTAPYVGVELCIPPNWDAWAATHGGVVTIYNSWLAPGKDYGPGGIYGNQYDPHPGTVSWTTQNDDTQTLCGTNNTSAVPVASCTPSAANAGNNWTTTTCATPTLTSNVPVASCTPSGPTSGNGYVTTTCNTVLAGPTGVSSCTPGTSASFVTTTCNPVATTAVPVASCAASGPTLANGYVTTTCPAPITTGPTQVASTACVPGTDASYVTTACTPVPGEEVQYQTTQTVTAQLISGGSAVGPATVTTSLGTVTPLDGVCYSAAQQPMLFATSPAFTAGGSASVRPPAIPTAVPTLLTSVAPAPTVPCAAWACVQTTVAVAGGSTNSLADVAQYYYINDLRPDLVDNVTVGPGGGHPLEDDRVKWQHMTTYTVGLGVSGTLNYTTDYQTGTGDFAGLRSGALNWPVWPTPTTTTEAQFNDPRSIDDFWHSAVDGRGHFFSANDPGGLIAGIKTALTSIASASGTGAGATMATPLPVAGNNAVYETTFSTGQWTGNVLALAYTGTGVSTSASWSAQANLDPMVSAQCDQRIIMLIHPGASSTNLVNFTWNSKACDASGVPTGAGNTGLNATEQAFFGATAVNNLSQFAPGGSSSPAQKGAAAGANLVNYLRGQKGFENYVAGNVNQLYRARAHALGDIVDSQLAYVPAPAQLYTDSDYASFVTDNAARLPMAYVGGNDGMLHAFYAPVDPTVANAGNELWAVIPTPVLPNLYALADVDYGIKHQFFVDGSPTTGDIYSTAAKQWKTILVSGLNGGGKGYYALDISNPNSPKALWEFTVANDANLGLTFGRPVITKMADGAWVVLVTSGYNNTGTGDGQGYLYILDADTGKLIKRMGTGVGDMGVAAGSVGPSGLRELTIYGSNLQQNNTAMWVYGGDLLGNIWRFDINGGGTSGVLVTTLRAPDGTAQSITTRVGLAEVDGNTLVMVGTGRLLGLSDSSTTQQQTVYSIKDPLTTPAATTPPTAEIDPSTLRSGLKPVAYTTTGSLTGHDLKRSAAPCSGTLAQCNSTAGWYWDLDQGLSDPLLGSERVSVDMALAAGTLVFESNIPSSAQCASGYNLFNAVDMSTGGAVAGNGVITTFLSTSLASGGSLLQSPSGAIQWCVTNADGSIVCSNVPVGVPAPVGKRISWREIAQ